MFSDWLRSVTVNLTSLRRQNGPGLVFISLVRFCCENGGI